MRARECEAADLVINLGGEIDEACFVSKIFWGELRCYERSWDACSGHGPSTLPADQDVGSAGLLRNSGGVLEPPEPSGGAAGWIRWIVGDGPVSSDVTLECCSLMRRDSTAAARDETCNHGRANRGGISWTEETSSKKPTDEEQGEGVEKIAPG